MRRLLVVDNIVWPNGLSLDSRGKVLRIVVPYVSYVWEKYVYFNVFYNVNEFYVFQQQLLHSPNELPAENCGYINGDTIFTLNREYFRK